jgi:hypothetical protein
VPAMFMMMDDLGQLFWRFGKRFLSSHTETEPSAEHAKGAPPALGQK